MKLEILNNISIEDWFDIKFAILRKDIANAKYDELYYLIKIFCDEYCILYPERENVFYKKIIELADGFGKSKIIIGIRKSTNTLVIGFTRPHTKSVIPLVDYDTLKEEYCFLPSDVKERWKYSEIEREQNNV